MKKLCLVMVLILFTTLLTPVSAAEEDIPSLFAGDEAWYKDAVSPLVIRDGVCCIPAELCSMFDYISVTTPRDDNLLICNTNTGEYVSVLFSKQSAAVNGKIVSGISVFRDSGMFYVDAELIAEAVGLTLEKYESPDGSISLRLSDEERIFTLDELISAYLPDEELEEDDVLTELEEEEIPLYDAKLKRIYVLCESSESDSVQFSAQESCEMYGVEYTLFLGSHNTTEDILSAYADGEYGIVADGEDVAALQTELDELNGDISVYTGRRTHFTLSTGDTEQDDALRAAGYIPIVPDFTVNGASYPDAMLPDIINYIGTAGSCTLYLEDCWNSERMVILLSEIKSERYRTANFSDAAADDLQ